MKVASDRYAVTIEHLAHALKVDETAWPLPERTAISAEHNVKLPPIRSHDREPRAGLLAKKARLAPAPAYPASLLYLQQLLQELQEFLSGQAGQVQLPSRVHRHEVGCAGIEVTGY
jgi:hypothetical protein